MPIGKVRLETTVTDMKTQQRKSISRAQLGSSPIELSPVAQNIVYMLFEDFQFIHPVFIAQKSSLK